MDFYATPTESAYHYSYQEVAPYDPNRLNNRDQGNSTFLISADESEDGFNSLSDFITPKKSISKKTSFFNDDNLKRESKNEKPGISKVEQTQLVSAYYNNFSSANHPQHHKSEIESISKSRFQLLIEKYSNDTISAEMAARLDILDKRLVAKSPRILESQVEMIAQSVEKLDSLKLIKESIAARLAEAAKR